MGQCAERVPDEFARPARWTCLWVRVTPARPHRGRSRTAARDLIWQAGRGAFVAGPGHRARWRPTAARGAPCSSARASVPAPVAPRSGVPLSELRDLRVGLDDAAPRSRRAAARPSSTRPRPRGGSRRAGRRGGARRRRRRRGGAPARAAGDARRDARGRARPERAPAAAPLPCRGRLRPEDPRSACCASARSPRGRRRRPRARRARRAATPTSRTSRASARASPGPRRRRPLLAVRA